MSKTKEIVEIKGLAVGKLKEPTFPKTWDYEKSLEKVKATIYKWTHLTVDIANELFIARRQLSVSHRPKLSGKNLPLTWATYCKEIGSERHTVNNWLRRFFGMSLLEEPEEEEKPNLEEIHLEKDTLECMFKSYPTKDRLFGDKCKISCPRKALCGQVADILINSPLLIEERRKLENLGFGSNEEESQKENINEKKFVHKGGSKGKHNKKKN